MNTTGRLSRALLAFALCCAAGLCVKPAALAASKRHTVKHASERPKNKLNPDEVVAKIAGEPVTVADLEAAFKKTSPVTASFDSLSYDSLKSFVDLYLNYRLKLKYAEDMQLEKQPDVEAELDQNRRSFAGPYLIERVVTEPAVRAMYDRRKTEYLVQQIQAAFPPSPLGRPSPADTLRAYQKAERLLEMLHQGADFTQLAEDSSDEPTARRSHGILPWLTGGETPRSFENAVYSLKKGELCKQPVRTSYGYFLIKILKVEPRSGGVRSSQILLSLPPNVSRKDTLVKYALADSLLEVLKHHQATFEELAAKFSEDKLTAEKGGDMGYHARGDRAMPKEYQEALFDLSDGEFCPRVIRTLYGYHIIKRTGTKPIGTFDEEKENLKVIYKRYFFKQDYEAFMDSLRGAFGFSLDAPALATLLSQLDTAHTSGDSAWERRVTPECKAMALYTLHGGQETVGAVLDTMEARPDLKGTALDSAGIAGVVNKIAEPQLLDLATDSIEQRYPEFKRLMDDVKDGILIYRLEQQEVWNKLQAEMTDSAVKAYWEPRKAQFLTPPRVDISEIYTVSDSLAKALYARLQAGANFDTLAAQNTLRVGFKQKAGHWGWYAAQDNPLAAKVIDRDPGFLSPPFQYESGYSIVRVNAKEAPHERAFKDAMPDAASQYQEFLSKKIMSDWVASLRARYPVSVNDGALRHVALANK